MFHFVLKTTLVSEHLSFTRAFSVLPVPLLRTPEPPQCLRHLHTLFGLINLTANWNQPQNPGPHSPTSASYTLADSDDPNSPEPPCTYKIEMTTYLRERPGLTLITRGNSTSPIQMLSLGITSIPGTPKLPLHSLELLVQS